MTKIFIDSGLLKFHKGDRLATIEEYELGDRCVGSIFEALEPGEQVELLEGNFILDEDLDLDKSVQKTLELVQQWEKEPSDDAEILREIEAGLNENKGVEI